MKWSYTIRNEVVYERTGECKCGQRIEAPRLKWLGHMMRLPEEAPVKQAMEEKLRSVKRPRRRQKHTWIVITNKQLNTINLSLTNETDQNLKDATSDKKLWISLINRGEVLTTGGNA